MGIWEYRNAGIFCNMEVVHHVHRVKIGHDRYPDGHFTRTALRTEEYETETEFCWCDHLLNACMKNPFKLFIAV